MQESILASTSCKTDFVETLRLGQNDGSEVWFKVASERSPNVMFWLSLVMHGASIMRGHS